MSRILGRSPPPAASDRVRLSWTSVQLVLTGCERPDEEVVMADNPRVAAVCVIGAGASGITAIKALADRGIAYDCFELGDRVGGVWVLGNTNGRAAAYASLHINTSRRKMQYAAFP